jgi:hypothetical protein
MDIKTQKLHEKLIKARAARRPKPDDKRKIAVSITLSPEHLEAIKWIGGGNISKGITMVCLKFGIKKPLDNAPIESNDKTIDDLI